MNLPNALTVLRIVLVPVFGALWLSGRFGAALWIFCVAGVTDLLDGLLARALDQRTRLGALLDPIADKFMLFVAFLVAAWVGAAPWWLAGMVVGRDVIMTSTAAIYTFVVHGRLDPNEWRPTRLGKYSTFYQLATIVLALVARTLDSDVARPWVGALALVTALLTTLSAIQYVSAGLRIFQQRIAKQRGELQ